ncbi:DNA-directed RNA polymerase subunit alpha [Candidatus Daviesbacteria bacterium]|nr:DNA-directed RNA polymerase subunit alpha [Candidatus Daviesbacteria bacterium]
MIKFKIKTENEKENYAKVVIEPLEQGYGHTLGNSLRRCMLNSLPGAAITSVKIAGVSHQFSTIPGVVEDVIEMILNLKKVRVKVFGEKSIRLSLQKSGKGEVRARDIDTLGQGEIVNGDQHIATITDPKVKLNMEMTCELGTGYVPADERKLNEIGVIPTDAIYTPVFSVNYTVDQTRVGRRTDFDSLVLEVTTDGTIEPQAAVEKAARILAGYFKQVYEPEEEVIAEVQTPSFVSDDLLKSSVEELDLPVRITNALKAIEIDTIGKLLTMPAQQLMKAKNLGAKSLTLISEKLAERGLSLGEA